MLGRLGIWIDRLDKCGTWESVVKQACKSGISWIAIKAGDAYRNNQLQSDTFVKQLDYAHKSGLEVLTWHKSRPQTWTAEVHLIQSLFKDGTNGHIVVPSVAWQGQSMEAARFVEAIKKKVVDGFVGFSVDAAHANSYPLDQFLTDLDGFYPVLRGDLKTSIDMMTKVTSAIGKRTPGAVKPMYPVLSTRGPAELSQAMNAFDGMPISLNSWEEVQGADTNIFPFLTKLNEQGLITLDVAEEPDTTVPADQQDEMSKAEDTSSDE